MVSKNDFRNCILQSSQTARQRGSMHQIDSFKRSVVLSHHGRVQFYHMRNFINTKLKFILAELVSSRRGLSLK